jgi:3-oxoacyl-[acyl-carrier protein] reductase
VSRAVEVYSGLDILVNNAGVGLLSSFESLDDSIIDERISADFKSVIYCS